MASVEIPTLPPPPACAQLPPPPVCAQLPPPPACALPSPASSKQGSAWQLRGTLPPTVIPPASLSTKSSPDTQSLTTTKADESLLNAASAAFRHHSSPAPSKMTPTGALSRTPLATPSPATHTLGMKKHHSGMPPMELTRPVLSMPSPKPVSKAPKPPGSPPSPPPTPPPGDEPAVEASTSSKKKGGLFSGTLLAPCGQTSALSQQGPSETPTMAHKSPGGTALSAHHSPQFTVLSGWSAPATSNTSSPPNTVTVHGPSTAKHMPTQLRPHRSGPVEQNGVWTPDNLDKAVVVTPWYPEGIERGKVRLDDEIARIAALMGLTETEREHRDRILNAVSQKVVTQFGGEAGTQPYGSFAVDTSSCGSALDILISDCGVLFVDAVQQVAAAAGTVRVARCEVDGSSAFAQTECALTGVVTNLCFVSGAGGPTAQSAPVARDMLNEFPAARPVHAVLRQVLNQTGNLDVAKGGISGHCLMMMLISCCRRLAKISVAQDIDTSQLLTNFCVTYGQNWDFSAHSIDPRTEAPVARMHPMDLASVVDPVQVSNNLAAGCTRLFAIRTQLQLCAASLMKWDDPKARQGYKGQTPLSSIMSFKQLQPRVQQVQQQMHARQLLLGGGTDTAGVPPPLRRRTSVDSVKFCGALDFNVVPMDTVQRASSALEQALADTHQEVADDDDAPPMLECDDDVLQIPDAPKCALNPNSKPFIPAALPHLSMPVAVLPMGSDRC